MAEAWKFFIVQIQYLVPQDQIAEIRAQHRTFLKEGYDKEWLLASGPLVPPTGGVVVARAPSREALEEFFARDPYHIHQAATHQIMEFNPVLWQGFLNEWMNSATV
jgi:uncharacterized protein YciI